MKIFQLESQIARKDLLSGQSDSTQRSCQQQSEERFTDNDTVAFIAPMVAVLAAMIRKDRR